MKALEAILLDRWAQHAQLRRAVVGPNVAHDRNSLHLVQRVNQGSHCGVGNLIPCSSQHTGKGR